MASQQCMMRTGKFSFPWSEGQGNRDFGINTMSIEVFSSSKQGPEPGCVLKSPGLTCSLSVLIWSPSWHRGQFRSFVCFSQGRSWPWFLTVYWPGEGELWEDVVAPRLCFAWTPMRAPVCLYSISSPGMKTLLGSPRKSYSLGQRKVCSNRESWTTI